MSVHQRALRPLAAKKPWSSICHIPNLVPGLSPDPSVQKSSTVRPSYLILFCPLSAEGAVSPHSYCSVQIPRASGEDGGVMGGSGRISCRILLMSRDWIHLLHLIDLFLPHRHLSPWAELEGLLKNPKSREHNLLPSAPAPDTCSCLDPTRNRSVSSREKTLRLNLKSLTSFHTTVPELFFVVPKPS